MCPKEKPNLLPDCQIANRVFMYSLLHSMATEDRCPYEVEADLRDRYEVFRQVLPNYPAPLHSDTESRFFYDIIEDDFDELALSNVPSSSSMQCNAPSSGGQSLLGWSGSSDGSDCCSDGGDNDDYDDSDVEQCPSGYCECYQQAVRNALAELRNRTTVSTEVESEEELDPEALLSGIEEGTGREPDPN
ncbi:uncharacterized protein LOC115626006 [Scaptodrosophila lebanonensis]|uniref:Uncharacterized protein LOC115626006 n=1 Tax=Drosophila lebanonensis TaxID=7225 RepID=A0A6J2TM33_DROLE|nr:uncharacterized protein LOC115626006 [Scaptodrosophila lebanonensis]